MPTIFIAVGVLAVAVAAGYRFLRPKKVGEEPTFYFRCTGCRRKLRYRARQIGNPGKCPTCKQSLVFPRPQPAEGTAR